MVARHSSHRGGVRRLLRWAAHNRLLVPAALAALATCSSHSSRRSGDSDSGATGMGAAAGSNAGGSTGCSVVSCYFPAGCRSCLDTMIGFAAGGIDCSTAVSACGEAAEGCQQTMACVSDSLGTGATRDCAVRTCLDLHSDDEPAALDFFLCMAATCADTCAVSTDLACP